MNEKRKYTCGVCRSHNVINDVKGHKNKCPFVSCHCEICEIKAKNVNINMAATVDSEAVQEPNVVQTEEPVAVQRFTIPVPQGQILFLQNNSNPITVDVYIYTGFAVLQGTIYSSNEI